MQRSFYVRAVWDAETELYCSESDIIGLHIETQTLDEFEEVMMDAASELIIANHRTADDYASNSLSDLIPAIVWQRPQEEAA